jgi:signal transduction histidine kinase
MAAVYGAAETLRRRGDELTPESQRRLVEMISDQASHLPRITQDVLLATELDRGGTALEREPVDVVEVARSAIDDRAGAPAPDRHRSRCRAVPRRSVGGARSASAGARARELVQRMGGRLEVQSQPGAGTTFVIELPRA